MIEAIGPRAARGLFATGRVFDAAHAHHLGLVDEVVADAAALDAAQAKLSADIMACAPQAVADARRLVADVWGRPIDHELMSDTAHRIAKARVSDEGKEGVAAFLEKRKPGWSTL